MSAPRAVAWPAGTEDIRTAPGFDGAAVDDTPVQVTGVERSVDGAVQRQQVRLTVGGGAGGRALNLNFTPAQARQLATALDRLATLFGA